MSRVLCLLAQVSAINLNPPLLTASSNLPPDIGRAALSLYDIAAANPPVYMILQPMGCTATRITTCAVSSYLAFSPLPF